MEMDDLEPRKNEDFRIGGDLSKLSIDELKDLAAVLAGEIARIEAEVRARESSRSVADSVFKS